MSHPATTIIDPSEPGVNIKTGEDLPLLVSPARASAELSLARRTVYDEIKAGRLKAVRFGRRMMIPRAELLRFIADLEKA